MLRAYNAEARTVCEPCEPGTWQWRPAAREGGVGDCQARQAHEHPGVAGLPPAPPQDWAGGRLQAKLAEEKEAERAERERLGKRLRPPRIRTGTPRLTKELTTTATPWAAVASGDRPTSRSSRPSGRDRARPEGVQARAPTSAPATWYHRNRGASVSAWSRSPDRRLDPRPAIYELGDASVPFRYDVHALCSGRRGWLEARLHQRSTLCGQLRSSTAEFSTPPQARSEPPRQAAGISGLRRRTRAAEWRPERRGTATHQRRHHRTAAWRSATGPRRPRLVAPARPARLLIHAGHLLTRGQASAHDGDDLAVAAAFCQRPGRIRFKAAPHLSAVMPGRAAAVAAGGRQSAHISTVNAPRPAEGPALTAEGAAFSHCLRSRTGVRRATALT